MRGGLIMSRSIRGWSICRGAQPDGGAAGGDAGAVGAVRGGGDAEFCGGGAGWGVELGLPFDRILG